jgi:hypothetical protein
LIINGLADGAFEGVWSAGDSLDNFYIFRPMNIRAREVAVAEFLRKALLGDALAVPKLEAMARRAGLLDEGQRITQVKLFRRAKRSLGIRSRRDGFGERGGWFWELPPGSYVSTTISARREPSTPREPVVPREWIEGVARLQQDRPPADVPRHQWHQLVEGCYAFLRSEALLHRAAQLGWDAVALFGCRRSYPLSYLGEAGLLWHVNGGRSSNCTGIGQ